MSRRRNNRPSARKRPEPVACLLPGRREAGRSPLPSHISFEVTPADVRRLKSLEAEHGWDLRKKR